MAVRGGFGSRRARRSTGRGVFLTLVGSVVVFGVIWLVGLVRFADMMPKTVAEPDRRTEAIVVLTGGSGRVATGVELLAADMADRLFVSGVYKGVDVKQLQRPLGKDNVDLEDLIDIGDAEDTIGNASESAKWIGEHRYTTVRLVTGAYHMPRALLEFRARLSGVSGQSVEMVPHPVFPPHVKHDRWWRWPGTAMLIAGEYNKYVLAWLRHRTLAVTAGRQR